jgi:hypothetical protein
MKRNYVIIIALSIFIIVILIFRKSIRKAMTRGYRNRNPGNIRKTEKLWEGEVKGTDKDFKTFRSMAYGYRALFALLREYISKDYNTIEKIINRYAPSSENATEAYIATVSRRAGIAPEDVLNFVNINKIKDIVAAISYVENGIPPNVVEIDNGYKLLTS